MTDKTNQEPEIKINYAFSASATDEHKKNCYDAVGVLVNAINTSKLAVVDCVYADDNTRGETILAALIDSEAGSAVLPLAKLFQEGEDVSTSIIPCIKLEKPAAVTEES